ncbi:MAG: alpha-N-acetylglucosaminidase C-terminal domain-containing protein, partial [Clostridia bacterium]|nr:alpha-N-acetylglucosaminidase C-terminal domain-containing protein [Clostridia bacterium]
TFERPYKNSELYALVKSALEIDAKKNENFRKDFVQLMRQVMSNALRPLYFKVNESFFSQDVQGFESATNAFIEIGEDLDRLLKTQEEPNLFYHIEQARLLGDNKVLLQNMEINFLMYHTIYGPVKNTVLYDNHWREWGGMAADFYLKRWHLCFRMMAAYFKTPKKMKYTSRKRRNDRNEFSDTLLAKRIEYFENEFIKNYIPRRTGIGEEDSIAVMNEIVKKYDYILKG